MLLENVDSASVSELLAPLRAFAASSQSEPARVVAAIAHALWVRYNSYEDAADAPNRNLHELVRGTCAPAVDLKLDGDLLLGRGRTPADGARMLATALAAPDAPLSEWEYIAPEERARILGEWNDTDAPWDETPLIGDLFERWVERAAERVAIVYGERDVTYRQFGERCAVLRGALRDAGVVVGDTVGVCIDRNPDLVAACMAIVQSGAAYVPLDPATPPERIAGILDDAGTRVAFISPEHAALLPPSVKTIDLQRIDATPAPPARFDPRTLAYIIYTSGSTGRPKGVEITHRNVVNFVDWVEHRFSPELRDGFVFASSIAFDVSVFEIFGALCLGGRMLIVENVLDLAAAPRRDAARIVSATSSGLTEIVHQRAVPPSVRVIMQAGERLSLALAREILETTQVEELMNLCGGTEDTVYSISTIVPRDVAEAPPIGKPFRHRRAYVLDRFLKLCPPGVNGEIHYAGPGVARGYRNRPELTAARFITNPYARGADDLPMYKSGDLARFREDGELEYVARIDLQVKIRGVRIELGEVEAAMNAHPAILESVAMARPHGNELRLVGYALVRRPVTLLELREHLKRTLPDAMIPTAFVVLESWPLTPNGKLDRAALPEPAVGRNGVAAPRTPAEAVVAELWRDVLGVDAGPDDDFFALGGHSLLAARVVARIRERMRAAISLRDLLRNPKLAAFAAVVERAPQIVSTAEDSFGRAERRELTAAQQHLWFLDQLLGKNAAYNVAFDLTVDGELDAAILERALAAVVERYPDLGAAVVSEEGVPSLIAASRPPEFAIDADPGALTGEPFDLASGPLVRAGMRRLPGETQVTVVAHHLVIDGASLPVFVRELLEAYAALDAGREPFENAPHQVDRNEEAEREARFARQLEFWRSRLAREVPPVALGAAELDEYHPGARIVRRLSPEQRTAMRRIAAAADSTTFAVGLTALARALHRRTGRGRVRIGTPVASRLTAAAQTVGYHVNMVTIESDVGDAASFPEALERLSAAAFEAFANSDVPYARVVAAAATRREISHSPLFNVVFVLQPPLERVVAGGFTARVRERFSGAAKFDLLVQLQPSEGGFLVTFEYRRSAATEAAIAALADEFERSLFEAASSSRDLVGLAACTETDATLHGWFDRIAAASPKALAASDERGPIAYGALKERADGLARALVEAGVEPGEMVGILVDRTMEMLVAILGVLKAGAAYVPLDPAHPAERLTFILKDAGISTLVTHRGMESLVPSFKGTLVDADVADGAPETPLPQRLPHDALAYVIYTSGSTGQPKGVLVEHRNVVRLFTSTQALFEFGERDVWTLFHSYAFDFSVWEMWGALLYGGKVVVVPSDATRAPAAFVDLLLREGVTVLNQTPSAFALVGDELLRRATSGALRHVIFGGEALVPRTLAGWLERFGDLRPVLTNMYGITETTVHVTHRRITAADARAEGSPIGEPIPDLRIDLLDERGEPVSQGEIGEIWVSGPGVARGYLNRPDVTAVRFRTLELGGVERSAYRSGDLARRSADGGLDYVGRIDRQVKIRGYRIELGEVENALYAHPAVSGAVVVILGEEASHRRLGAYLTLRTPLELDDLVASLRARVPHYMVPSVFRMVSEFPLTANGKIDYAALPSFEGGIGRGVAPSGENEERIAAIWRELLDLDEVSADDNFFSIGGHSLLAARMVAAVQAAFERPVSLARFYVEPTIAALARGIDEAGARNSWVELLPKTGDRATLFWFHGMLTTEGWYVRNLAQHLDGGLVVFHPHGWDGVPPPETVEEMAEQRLREIRALQPHGPYRLGGFCNGALLAYHIAARLRELGEEVEQLVLASSSIVNRKYLLLVRAIERVGKLFGVHKSRRNVLADRATGYLFEFEQLLVNPQTNRLWNLSTVRKRWRAKMRQRALRFVDPQNEGRFVDEYRRAIMAYDPPRYDGPVTLVWGNESRVEGWA
ncbi:MAG: amino acid adenylation domain-containing protein, partial [Candidatus Eremiobacteraeota bacterium]|nr:amino acid adenylation domain-containing protein [Candidatus Eremiobacteraeota bacterium]